MTQAFFSVFKRSNIILMFLCLALFLFSSLVNGDNGNEGSKYLKPIAVPNPATDLWRAVRQGQSGFVANPGRNPDRLMFGIPKKDCTKAGNCTEQVVGFSLPIHALVPGISEKRGNGATTTSFSFVLSILAGLGIAGLIFVVKLTKSRSGNVTTHGDSTK